MLRDRIQLGLFMLMVMVLAHCASNALPPPKPLLSFGADTSKGPVFYPVIAVKLKSGKAETLLPMKPYTSYDDCVAAAEARAVIENMRAEVDDVLFECVAADFNYGPPINHPPDKGI